MGYISKVKIPSEAEAYDIFADRSLKDGDGNVISTTYSKTADAPKIGTADTSNELKKIEYTEESDIPSSPDVGTEYACTDFIGYDDLDSNLQSTLSNKADLIPTPDSGTVLYGVSSGSTDGQPQAITAGDGIVIAAKEDGTGAEVRVDPEKYVERYKGSEYVAYTQSLGVDGQTRVSKYANPGTIVLRNDVTGDFDVNSIYLYKTRNQDGTAARLIDVGRACEITGQPASATAGTLTEEQLIILKGSGTSGTQASTTGNAYILFNNERYYPMSYGHEEGYQTYSNVSDDEIKQIKVNMTSGEWTLTTSNVGGTVVTTDGVVQPTVATEDFVKHTSNATQNIVYTSSKGVDVSRVFTNSPLSATMMYRDNTGNTYVNDPTNDLHCANKRYVDAKASALNIQNGTGTGALKQVTDPNYSSLEIKTKNPNAAALDSTLTDSEPIGATGDYASAFGGNTSAQGKRSCASGTSTLAKGAYSHAEGDGSVALGDGSHVEGCKTTASGASSHAGGQNSIAEGNYSFAHGNGVHTKGVAQSAFGVGIDTGTSTAEGGMFTGKYNAPTDDAIFQIGNGTGDTARSNAVSVDIFGNAAVAGRLSVVGAPVNDNDVVRKVDLASAGGGGASWHTEKPADTSKVQFTRVKILTTDNAPSAMVGNECMAAGYTTSVTGIWCVAYSDGIRIVAGNASVWDGKFGFTGTYLPEVAGSFLDTPNGGTCSIQYYY